MKNLSVKPSHRFAGEVVIATKFGWGAEPQRQRQVERSEQPTGPHQTGCRRIAQTFEGRCYRSLLSTSGRPECSDRRCCRRCDESDSRRQGEALRSLGSERTDNSPGTCSSARHCTSERIFAVLARAGRDGDATLEELGIGSVPFSPLGKGFLTGKIDVNTKFEQHGFPQQRTAFHSGESQSE